jgi:hypothetical protein
MKDTLDTLEQQLVTVPGTVKTQVANVQTTFGSSVETLRSNIITKMQDIRTKQAKNTDKYDKTRYQVHWATRAGPLGYSSIHASPAGRRVAPGSHVPLPQSPERCLPTQCMWRRDMKPSANHWLPLSPSAVPQITLGIFGVAMLVLLILMICVALNCPGGICVTTFFMMIITILFFLIALIFAGSLTGTQVQKRAAGAEGGMQSCVCNMRVVHVYVPVFMSACVCV